MTAPAKTIDGALRNVLCNASNYPERVQSRILGTSSAPLIAKATEAVEAVLAAPSADLVERAAEAARVAYRPGPVPWAELDDALKEHWRNVARAVLGTTR